MNAPATALQFDYGEFPTLTTVRLRLRELRPSDRDGVFALRSDAEVQRYNSEPMRRIGEADAFIAEIGYDLARACWGRGIGAEAVGAVIRFGFGALRLHRLEADTLADNFARCACSSGWVSCAKAPGASFRWKTMASSTTVRSTAC